MSLRDTKRFADTNRDISVTLTLYGLAISRIPRNGSTNAFDQQSEISAYFLHSSNYCSYSMTF